MHIYRAEPKGTPRGAIVVIQEIFGVNAHIRDVADGFAADGYVAVAPALFDRIRPGIELGYTPDTVREGRELRSKLAIDDVLADVQTAIDSVKSAGKIGIVGYCWGGYVTWMAAARCSGLACAVDYYGTQTLDAMDEHPRCPVMLHFGSKDATTPADKIEALRGKHEPHGAQFFVYDADHGFNCDERGSYDAAATKLARERTLAFFREHVG
ncbi:MAG TPA: dienelactone hydrolase family protein [Kofleriaceae bacterium]|nr:dienelactone hydrolase family protein [Kofleriaceae bacterium]